MTTSAAQALDDLHRYRDSTDEANAVSHFLRVCWKRSTFPVVVGPGVFLGDVQVGEPGFELVSSASVAGEACGVDEAVVGEH